MQNIISKCRKIIASPYKLSILAAKRARQLQMGAPPLSETKFKNYTNVALLEIADGKVTYENILELEKSIDLRKLDTRLIKFGTPEKSDESLEESEILEEPEIVISVDEI